MLWLEALVPAIAALLVSVVPGLVVAWAGGFRGFAPVGLAPLVSAALIAGTAVLAPWLHMRWGLIPLLLGTAVAALAMWWAPYLVERFVKRRSLQTSRRKSLGAVRIAPAEARWAGSLEHHWPPKTLGQPMTWATVVGLVVSVVVLTWRLSSIFRAPEYVSQTADNVFHLNAVRFIVDTGNGSSLALGAAGGAPPSLYPGGWHDLVALVVQTTGASIPVSVTAANLVIGAVLWPVTVVFLARTVFGRAKIVDLSSSVLACCFGAFPYLLVDWGVLYPNYYGMAVMPALVGLGALLARSRSLGVGIAFSAAALFAISSLGLLIVHPNTVLTAAVIVVPLWVGRLWILASGGATGPRSLRRERRWSVLGIAALLVLSAIVWVTLRPFPLDRFDITWPPYESPGQALGEFLLTTHSGWLAGFGTSVVFVAGLILSARRRSWRWLFVASGIWGLLFVSVAGYQTSYLRGLITGGWYTDFKRIAAGCAVIALMVGVAGLKTLGMELQAVLRRRTNLGSRATRKVSSIAVLVVVVCIGAVSQTTNVAQATAHAQSNYSLGPGSPIMSADELALYQKIDALVPPNSMIAGNPWDGSAWAYFVSGRQVLFPHVLTPWTYDRAVIAAGLNQASADPLVCTSLRRLNIHYALTSDELIYLPGNPATFKYPGMAGLELAKGFEEIASVGQNHLYRITACW